MKERLRKINAISMLKPGVNDPEGNTIKEALHKLGFDSVTDVRVGKALEILLEESGIEKLAEELKDDPRKKDFPGLGSRVLNNYYLTEVLPEPKEIKE